MKRESPIVYLCLSALLKANLLFAMVLPRLHFSFCPELPVATTAILVQWQNMEENAIKSQRTYGGPKGFLRKEMNQAGLPFPFLPSYPELPCSSISKVEFLRFKLDLPCLSPT